VFLLCLSVVWVGCKTSETKETIATGDQTSQNDHDHAAGDAHDHQHPENLKDAVTTLAELYAKIKPAFENKDPDAAHGELHEVAHLLDEVFPGLIKKDSAMSAESKTKLEGVISKLFDAFFKLDDVLHGGPEVDFGPIDTSIASAIEELKTLLP